MRVVLRRLSDNTARIWQANPPSKDVKDTRYENGLEGFRQHLMA